RQTLVRNIRLVMALPSADEQVARHALLVATIGVTELAFEISLLAHDHAEMQQQAARDDQQNQPVQCEEERDAEQYRQDPDIERIARPAENAAGDKGGGGLQWVDVSTLSQQSPPAGTRRDQSAEHDYRTHHDTNTGFDIRDPADWRQPLQQG